MGDGDGGAAGAADVVLARDGFTNGGVQASSLKELRLCQPPREHCIACPGKMKKAPKNRSARSSRGCTCCPTSADLVGSCCVWLLSHLAVVSKLGSPSGPLSFMTPVRNREPCFREPELVTVATSA